MLTTLEISFFGSVKVQPITHAICRIGSNPGLELCIPGIDDHVVTLRIQNGKRLVYNRSSKAIKLNGVAIQPEQTQEWRGNQQLELGAGIHVRLLNSKEELKSNQAASTETVATQDGMRAAQAPAARRSSQRPLIAGFFLVFATILFSSQSKTTPQADTQFSKLIQTLTEAELQPNSGRYREMRVELQNAYLRTDLKAKCKRDLKQMLLFTTPQSNPTIDAQVQRFVDAYL